MHKVGSIWFIAPQYPNEDQITQFTCVSIFIININSKLILKLIIYPGM
jgi:hypothetical protein